MGAAEVNECAWARVANEVDVDIPWWARLVVGARVNRHGTGVCTVDSPGGQHLLCGGEDVYECRFSAQTRARQRPTRQHCVLPLTVEVTVLLGTVQIELLHLIIQLVMALLTTDMKLLWHF